MSRRLAAWTTMIGASAFLLAAAPGCGDDDVPAFSDARPFPDAPIPPPDAALIDAVPGNNQQASVWLLGTTLEGSCTADALVAFHPEAGDDVRNGFPCGVDWYRFRRPDNRLFFHVAGMGIYANDPGGDHLLVATPPCDAEVEAMFDFDATGRMYYRCGEFVYRDGELLTGDVNELTLVLADGRFVAVRSAGPGNEDYVISDASGIERARVTGAGLTGTVQLLSHAATADGDVGYVAFGTTTGAIDELVVYEIGDDNATRMVDRLNVPAERLYELATPSGDVFIRLADPDSPGDELIRRYAMGSSAVVWREAEQGAITSFGHRQLLRGP